MQKKNNKNIIIAIIIAIIGAVVLAFVVKSFLDTGLLNRQIQASESKLETVKELVEDANEEEKEETEVFDELNISKASTIALLAQNDADFSYTDSYMAKLREIVDVYNVLIIDKEGNITCSAISKPKDYGMERFNQLREAFDNETSTPFSISWDDEDITLRYYGAKIDSDHMVVVVRDTEVLDKKLEYESSLESILSDVHVGKEGFVFAVSSLDYTFLYYPDEEYIGKSAVTKGIDVALLSDGVSEYITIDGESYLSTVGLVDNTYYVCAVPQSEILGNRNATIIIVLVIYIIAAGIILLYAFFAGRDKKLPRDKKEFKKFVSGRLLSIAVLGVIAIFALTLFVETLFALSGQSVTNSHRMQETIEEIDASLDYVDYVKEEYDESYLEKTAILAETVKQLGNDKLTLDFMQKLRDALGVENAAYIGLDGKTIASSSSFWGFTLSSNKDDQSYEFRKILDGSTNAVVQEAEVSDDGNYTQYIGQAVEDDSHQTIGLVQIQVQADALKNALEQTELKNVLSQIQTGNNGFVFAVNKETLTFDYFPDESLKGLEAVNNGMKENQLVGGFSDFITVDGTNYYCLSQEYNGEILYVAVPMDTLNNMSVPTALVAFGVCVIIFLILWLFLRVSIHSSLEGVEEDEEESKDEEKEMIDVDRGDGKKVKARSILSRFSAKSIPWDEKTSGQKVGTIFKFVLVIVAIFLMVLLIFADSIFSSDSIILYILKGTWQKGFNIFAITQCVVIIVAVSIISLIVRKILQWFADRLGAKGETVVRLINSFIRLATIVGIIYACLSAIGVDTTVLLTSAGILTLIVGLGANSLIKDLLAGLMIVFEGSFQVGDIVTVNGFRGTVVEIGIRTTKIKEGGGNIKVFPNSEVGDVLNMTKDFSVVAIDMSIEYGEDLEYVEKILSDEFDNIRRDIPEIKDGPFYKGVSELGDNSVNIKIVAKCDEADRIQLDRDLRRKLKLIFDKYDISIPYPQVVINEPTTNFHKTNFVEKEEAEEFLEEQNEASKEIFEEQN